MVYQRRMGEKQRCMYTIFFFVFFATSGKLKSRDLGLPLEDLICEIWSRRKTRMVSGRNIIGKK